MSLAPLLHLLRRKQLIPALKTNALFKPFYQLSFIAAARNSGLMEELGGEGKNLQQLGTSWGSDAKSQEAMTAWLQVGESLGLIEQAQGSFRLKGLASVLSQPENDATLALAQEVAELHHKLIMQTPEKLRQQQLWQLSDQNGELTARSSRALEAFQIQAIDKVIPGDGSLSLLEIGCGSGFYIQYAMMRNPALRVLGLELQAEVAEVARRYLRTCQPEGEVTIEVMDIRDKPAAAEFDIASLYNNIYYFPVEERVALLRHIRSMLKPQGRLLLTTCCQGGNPGIGLLNLWGAATAGGGRLPSPEEMQQQLHQAGYAAVDTWRLIPGDSFYAFCARNQS